MEDTLRTFHGFTVSRPNEPDETGKVDHGVNNEGLLCSAQSKRGHQAEFTAHVTLVINVQVDSD